MRPLLAATLLLTMAGCAPGPVLAPVGAPLGGDPRLSAALTQCET